MDYVFPAFGSKTRLAPRIVEALGAIRFKTYVEPFAGSASIFLHLHHAGLIPDDCVVVLNDADGDITNAFEVIRTRGDELAQAIRATPYAQVEVRRLADTDTDSLERARRFMAWAFMTYPCEVASARRFVQDRGNQYVTRWARLPERLLELVEPLRRAVIRSQDALTVIKRYAGPDTLLMVDPPYAGRAAAYRAQFDNHADLWRLLSEVEAAGVVVTHADDPQVRGALSPVRWTAYPVTSRPAAPWRAPTGTGEVIFVRRSGRRGVCNDNSEVRPASTMMSGEALGVSGRGSSRRGVWRC